MRERIGDRPELCQEIAKGVMYWLEATGGRVEGGLDARYDYQSMIRQLLPIVDEQTADQLFEKLSINDLESYENQDDASGYNPLKRLLFDSEVPDRYKMEGLRRWFEVAEKECSGERVPREDHEQAIRNMIDFVVTASRSDAVDKGIYSSIVAFIDRHIPTGQNYIDNYNVCQVADRITNKDLLFDFAWRHIFAGNEPGRPFRIDNVRELALVEMTREEANARLAANDRVIGRHFEKADEIADAMIADYKTRVAEADARKAKADAKEASIQAKLRV